MTDKPHARIWDDSYEPTQAELDEPIQLEGAHDYSFEEVVGRILS